MALGLAKKIVKFLLHILNSTDIMWAGIILLDKHTHIHIHTHAHTHTRAPTNTHTHTFSKVYKSYSYIVALIPVHHFLLGSLVNLSGSVLELLHCWFLVW